MNAAEQAIQAIKAIPATAGRSLEWNSIKIEAMPSGSTRVEFTKCKRTHFKQGVAIHRAGFAKLLQDDGSVSWIGYF